MRPRRALAVTFRNTHISVPLPWLLPKAPEYVLTGFQCPRTPRAVIRESLLLQAFPAIPRKVPRGLWSGLGARAAFVVVLEISINLMVGDAAHAVNGLSATTGAKMAHYIVDGGPFGQARRVGGERLEAAP
jgi:hypothetical protein